MAVTDEYYWGRVGKNETVNPLKLALEKEKSETSTGIPPKYPRNTLPGGKPYLSVGVSLAKGEATEEADFAGLTSKENYTDVQPMVKAAFGSQFNPYFRTEVFFQYRGKLEDEPKVGNIPITVTAKRQDTGFNAFITANPRDRVRLFIGAGLAATRVQPTISVYGIKSDELFESGWFATPSGFIGIEYADRSDKIVFDITAFYSKTFINKEYTAAALTDTFKDITAYGISLNTRFNL